MRRGGFRRRLIIAFVLVAAVSSGALAVASYLLVRQARLTDFLHEKQFVATVDLEQARGLTPTVNLAEFLRSYQGTPAVMDFPGRTRIASDPRIDPPIPGAVQHLVEAGQLGYAEMTVGRTRYLMIGGRAAGSEARLYFFFSEQGIWTDLALLRTRLLMAWLGVVVVALVIGRVLARRTLDPVARASQAATAIAHGQLGTRLEVRAPDEFGAWAVAFNDMADALEGRIERERQFTSDVAHELRTPVTALVAAASLLDAQVPGLPDGARRPTELLIGDVRRLRTLVDELMEISRLDAGSEPVRAQRFELHDFIAALLRARDWTDQVMLTGEPVFISTDPRRLERIIANLVGNALEHGRVAVGVDIGVTDSVMYVSVTDSGQGIAPQHAGHVFERFYKADPARAGSGSGLGLAIALENARLLGGDITLSTEVGRGCEFRLSLPAVSES